MKHRHLQGGTLAVQRLRRLMDPKQFPVKTAAVVEAARQYVNLEKLVGTGTLDDVGISVFARIFALGSSAFP